ncbi:MAG: glycosyltransferase [Bacteroidaceae bacterium]|nr:glycosyltransferase [Bacteroidaceae bacterium]
MFEPLISVIIPNYNHARYLNQRIDSVLSQTYTNYEVIILDDCSTDNSKNVIEQYRNNPKVSAIEYNETNSGSTFKQWNKGFQLAKGEYIWIAESDDFCENTILDELILAIQKFPDVVIAFSSFCLVDGKGNAYKLRNDFSNEVIMYEGNAFIQNKMIAENSICNASSVLFKKDSALKISRAYMNYKACGDYLFWVMLAETGNVVHVDKCLDYFRRDGLNVTVSAMSNGLSYLENYKILRYIKGRKLMTIGQWLRLKIAYVEKILTDNIEEKGRIAALNKWDSLHLIRLGVVRGLYWHLFS